MVKYEITLSADQKQIEKKIWYVWDKGIYLTDETRMINVYERNNYALEEYQNAFKNFFKDKLTDGKTLYTDMFWKKKRGINKMALLQHEQV